MITWTLLVWFTLIDAPNIAYIDSKVGIQIIHRFGTEKACNEALNRIKLTGQRLNGVCVHD